MFTLNVPRDIDIDWWTTVSIAMSDIDLYLYRVSQDRFFLKHPALHATGCPWKRCNIRLGTNKKYHNLLGHPVLVKLYITLVGGFTIVTCPCYYQ